MGVMLALDRPRQPRSRRHGQHARYADQACVDALAAFLRSDVPGADRCLGRLARTVLARRLLPAAAALAKAVGAVLAVAAVPTDQAPSSTRVTIDLTVSPACLAGECRDRAERPGCQSSACEHGCHSDTGESRRDGIPAA